MTLRPKPIPNELMSAVQYDNGKLLWKNHPQAHRNGKEAGRVCSSTGYLDLKFRPYGMFAVHRVIATMFYGELLPGQCVDHINGNRLDNRIENLRIVNASQNGTNRRASKCPFGIRKTANGKYQVVIFVNKKPTGFGTYDMLTAASVATQVYYLLNGHYPYRGVILFDLLNDTIISYITKRLEELT